MDDDAKLVTRRTSSGSKARRSYDTGAGRPCNVPVLLRTPLALRSQFGDTPLYPSVLSPNRDCSTKRVNTEGRHIKPTIVLVTISRGEEGGGAHRGYY